MARNQSEELRPKEGVEWIVMRMTTPSDEHEAALVLKWDQARVDLLRSACDHFSQFERLPALPVLAHISYRDAVHVFWTHSGFGEWRDQYAERAHAFTSSGEVLLAEEPDTSQWEPLVPDTLHMVVEGDRTFWLADDYSHGSFQSDNYIRIGERSVFA